jgi:hypothetical protein
VSQLLHLSREIREPRRQFPTLLIAQHGHPPRAAEQSVLPDEVDRDRSRLSPPLLMWLGRHRRCQRDWFHRYRIRLPHGIICYRLCLISMLVFVP